MKANIRSSAPQSVAIGSITPYPNNARHGDIEAIAKSLEAHGQFRDLTVQIGTNYILAGNHTYKAMKKLGFKKVRVVFVDVDDAMARKIVLADNRTTDKAGYNEPLLKSILEALPDLKGTGFSQTDLDTLGRILDYTPPEQKDPKSNDPMVKIGVWKFSVELDSFEAWKEQLQFEVGKSKARCVEEIKRRLGFPEREEVKVIRDEVRPSDSGIEGEQTVPIGEVLPHPLNPREGDIGAIMESLKEFGQYRPIVVNKRTNHCLVGNHTLQAMAGLGYEKVAVSWVDVDDETEIKILIVDNRTSDLATYMSLDLHKLLMQSQDLKGTGFTREEVAEILAGGKSSPRYTPVGRTNIKVGEYTTRVHNEDLNSWSNAIYRWEDVVELLQLPLQSCHGEERE